MTEPNFCGKCGTLYSGSKSNCPNCTSNSIVADDIALEETYDEFLPKIKDIWVSKLKDEVIERWKSKVESKTKSYENFDFKVENKKNGWSKVNIETPLDKEKIDIINDLVESGAGRVSFKRRDRNKTSLVSLTIRGERIVEVRPK